MNEKLKDITIDLLLDGVKKKIDNVKEKYKWQELFVSTGSFFVNNPDTLKMFEQDLFSVFSQENLKQMAKKLKDKRGYEFPQLLHRELYDLMVCYEIPAMEAETYIHHFIQVIINYLEENDPDKTMEIFLGDLKKEIETHFFTIESKLELVLHQIEDLRKEEVLSYSIADIDIQIRRESKYKGMGLDFFKLDDEQFEARFQNVINDERIYVVGKCREETTYRILNELRQKNSDRVTLIIKSEEEWNKLQKANLSGNILLPFFYAERIVAIPNNTNIFVYGEDEPCYTRDKVVLRKRTKRNIIKSLEEIGIEPNEAYNMVDNTHGLYVPLKKKIFNGAMYSIPDWVEGHSDVVMAALLCGKWTEATGDVLIFEELSGKTYIECKKELEGYLHRENPYIVTHNGYGGGNMQLASVEDAWEELDIYITDELWDKFITLFYEVLIESEPIFEYPFEKHFEASIYAKKPEWSPNLKKGMIRTLIMRAYYRGHEENQKQIDNIVSRVFDTITSKERWGYISQYLTDLCEASPESVLRKLENELQQPQGLLELFAVNGGDLMTSRNYYTNVLWTVEQLVQQKKYVVRALEWLWKVDSYNIKYSISNSPKGVLDVVFCAWINESALSVDKKIELARNAIEMYPNAWEVIVSKLPQGTSSICSTLNTPIYRKIDEPDVLYVHEVKKTYIEYLRMCVDSAYTDAERWIKIIQHIDSYDVTIQNEVFEKLVFNCREMSDGEKIKVKNIIRHEIYRHRYFCDADWSMSEEALCRYECLMDEIVLSEKIYDYLYLFSSVYEFPLLHPVPFCREESKDSREKNHILREEEIKTRFKEFKEKEYSLEKLIELAVKEEHSILGEVLAQFYCDGMFDEKIFNLLMERDEEGKCVYDYVRYLHRNGTVDLNKVIGMVKNLSDNNNLLVNLISLEFIEDDENALISREGEEIKKMYWGRNVRLRISDKAGHKVFIWALGECKKYGSVHTYLELLYDVRDKISNQELYNAIFGITDFRGDAASSMTDYYLEEILKELQEAFIMDDEKCAELATLEWMCRNVLEWEQMKCMQKVMKNDPTLYAQLVRIIYKANDYESDNEEKRVLANKVYAGFDKAKFCPAEKDGKVSFENLKNWMEKFKDLLNSQKQERLFGNLVGRLLAYSPIGEDGYSPCEAVRRIIEEYYSESLKNSYVIAEQNKRGVHTVDAGKSELLLHDRYQKNAEGLQEQYPRTAEIYFTLSDIYKREADFERKRAEDEW
ncbi:hypothetical protein [Sharpea azabuensis]|uniref:hypothetical protein n=1 Tax=Sharpea azabuensis TaxID=322505 RepID=UPI00051BEA3F|nr:hypothetical protein [Sharpea azabuensis]